MTHQWHVAFRRSLVRPVVAVSGHECHSGGSREQQWERDGQCCHQCAWRASRLTRMTLPSEAAMPGSTCQAARREQVRELISFRVTYARHGQETSAKKGTHRLGWLRTSTARAYAILMV